MQKMYKHVLTLFLPTAAFGGSFTCAVESHLEPKEASASGAHQ